MIKLDTRALKGIHEVIWSQEALIHFSHFGPKGIRITNFHSHEVGVPVHAFVRYRFLGPFKSPYVRKWTWSHIQTSTEQTTQSMKKKKRGSQWLEVKDSSSLRRNPLSKCSPSLDGRKGIKFKRPNISVQTPGHQKSRFAQLRHKLKVV